MNKNLKHLFVTTAILTSFASTNDAHATGGAVEQYWESVKNLKTAETLTDQEDAVKNLKEFLENRVEWFEGGKEDITSSVLFNTSIIRKILPAQKDREEISNVKAIMKIIEEYEPLRQEVKKRKRRERNP